MFRDQRPPVRKAAWESEAQAPLAGTCLRSTRPLPGNHPPFQTSDFRQVIHIPNQDAASPQAKAAAGPNQSQTSDFLRFFEGITRPPRLPNKAFRLQHQRGRRRQQAPSQPSDFRPFQASFQSPTRTQHRQGRRSPNL